MKSFEKGVSRALLVFGFLVILGLMALLGCEPTQGFVSMDVPDLNISRYIDHEAGVVCWVVRAGSTDNATIHFQPAGISCLPARDTALDVGISR